MVTTAIKVDNISKMYKLYDRPMDRLKESLRLTKEVKYRPHYALNDVSFHVEKGETIGIIGTNGAGKSTILKIITGVLNQTSGNIEINGRISALLELGAGFNMEYTGIENIYLNGTMIGFSKEEIDSKLEGILAFADIGEFVHQPVRTYSSGMFVRLAFAVAINIDPEILIVDEALSVGDVFFQAKCYKKFEEFRKQGKTIIIVSHDLGSISRYCDRAILLNQGSKLGEGSPKDMINLYKKVLVNQLDGLEAHEVKDENNSDDAKDRNEEQSIEVAGRDTKVDREQSMDVASRDEDIDEEQSMDVASRDEDIDEEKSISFTSRNTEISITGSQIYSKGSQTKQLLQVNPNYIEYGNKKIEIIDFAIYDEQGNVTGVIMKGSTFVVAIKVKVHERIEDPIIAFTIINLKGDNISGTNTMYENVDIICDDIGEELVITFTQEMNFQGGEYLLNLGCTGYNGDEFTVYHRLFEVCSINVISNKSNVGFFDMNSKINVEVLRQ